MPNRPTSDTAARVRTVPQRSPEFAHLSLDGLRAYRRTLTDEEGRVSYWRRIVQARIDLVRATAEGTSTTVDNLRGVFAEPRVAGGRTSMTEVFPASDAPPLPDLPSLWQRQPRLGDADHNGKLLHDLQIAESQLSAYRSALHRRLAAATGELIARYREDPTLCLTVLPTRPRARHAGTATAAG